MKKRQITIKDIAKALHISPSTVSRSLADHPDISQETKNIVNAYAREHKYKPNALALSLRTNNTKQSVLFYRRSYIISFLLFYPV